MRLTSYLREGRPALGVRLGDELIELDDEPGLPGSPDDCLGGGAAAMDAVRRAADRSRRRRSIESVTFLPPLQAPGKAIAVGLNYVDHASESQLETPSYPVLFQRYASSWVAHGQPLVRPLASTQFDYEGELVVVIGRAGRRIAKGDALAHVAGYSIFNDGSVRDYQFKSSQWLMGKNFDRSGAFGPDFVTADELPPGAVGLKLRTRLNGEVVQDANTRDMIFDVPTLVAVCSEAFELRPGDILISGTPAGVGFARKPPLFMKAGDRCEVEIEGVGLLSNPVVDEA